MSRIFTVDHIISEIGKVLVGIVSQEKSILALGLCLLFHIYPQNVRP
jgi:hypothetical protein